MADALVSSLVNVILGNLNSVALQEFGIASGLRTEIESLKSTFSTIQAVLQDAEVKQRKSVTLQDWLRKLKDAAYDVENILDEIQTEALTRRVRNQVSTFFSLQNPFVFRARMGHKIKAIRERLDAIAGERFNFHLREGISDQKEVGDIESRQTSSLLVNESEIFGRKEEKEKIIEVLLNNLSDCSDVSVYAICGMGGLGKTTLTQMVYNDERVQRHFELRIWVCVSDDFDIQRLTRAILESIEGGACDISELDPLQRRLQEKLSGRRFLLALDDVWNEYHEKWDRLKDALSCGAKGSTVIVTTRIEKVALLMATLPIQHMRCLSEDDSWSLFTLRAFGIGRRERNSGLETIGKAIVKKCGGVPLAVKALGSLMRFKDTENEWLSVKESEIWDLQDDGSKILPALRLSYDNLTPHSRQCFAYSSIYCKDSVMKKDTLIQLWLANGFIPSKGQTELHYLGQEIFNDLVWRSFLQDVEEDFEGEMTCKMHDLMHDLAQSIMRFECSIIESSKDVKIPEKVRHLSFNMNSSRTFPWNEVTPKAKSLRSFISLSGCHIGSGWNTLSTYILNQKYLRVLDVGNERYGWSLPVSMRNLKHLRYLSMSFSDIRTLPESTSCLQNLQTLKLKGCQNLRKLPKGMKHMRNLRYLDIRLCSSLNRMPAKMGQLIHLQTLSKFIVGKDRGHHLGELKELNLGGELSLEGLYNVRNSMDAKSANLNRKQNLTSLSLSWKSSNRDNLPENVEEVLEGLQPHLNLKILSISFYQGSRFPNWMLDLDLVNLVEISLEGCGRCEHLPPLGKLPFLRVLALVGMDVVKCFNNECNRDGKNSFPVLEWLKLSRMLSLEEWTTADRGENFPCLRELTINRCPRLTELPHLPTLKRLNIEESNVILIRSVMNLTSISSLYLQYFSEVEVLPDGLLQNHRLLEDLQLVLFNLKTLSNELDNLSSLKVLDLQCCLNLESLPEGLQNLTSLARLHLSGCKNLESLPQGLQNLTSLECLDLSDCQSLTSLPANGLRGLSSLRSLSIQNCKKLASLSEGVRHLTALKDVLINGCPEMRSLPEGMQQLTDLRELRIWHCEGLFSLPNWLGSLQSLSYLDIRYCPNLMSLPDGLQSLDALKTLRIEGCPHLERRCKKERGEDSPKIARIPNIWINGQQIQSLDS